jgi:hypothetical protein
MGFRILFNETHPLLHSSEDPYSFATIIYLGDNVIKIQTRSVCLLFYLNIYGDEISFIRKGTQNTLIKMQRRQ